MNQTSTYNISRRDVLKAISSNRNPNASALFFAAKICDPSGTDFKCDQTIGQVQIAPQLPVKFEKVFEQTLERLLQNGRAEDIERYREVNRQIYIDDNLATELKPEASREIQTEPNLSNSELTRN